jgi:hypothetical protein
VDGDNIEALTFTLNQGEFSDKPEGSMDAAEYYGKECSLTYEEQKDRNYLYSISFNKFRQSILMLILSTSKPTTIL